MARSKVASTIILFGVVAALAACESFPKAGVIQTTGAVGMYVTIVKTGSRCILPPAAWNTVMDTDGSELWLTDGVRVEVLERGGCSFGADVFRIRVIESGIEGWIYGSAITFDGRPRPATKPAPVPALPAPARPAAAPAPASAPPAPAAAPVGPSKPASTSAPSPPSSGRFRWQWPWRPGTRRAGVSTSKYRCTTPCSPPWEATW